MEMQAETKAYAPVKNATSNVSPASNATFAKSTKISKLHAEVEEKRAVREDVAVIKEMLWEYDGTVCISGTILVKSIVMFIFLVLVIAAVCYLVTKWKEKNDKPPKEGSAAI